MLYLSKLSKITICLFSLYFLSPPICHNAHAQDISQVRFEIGSPTVTDIWVDPIFGNNANSGTTRNSAVRTVIEAWSRIPRAQQFTTTGYRIRLVAGTYPRASLPHYWEERYGTYQFPTIIEAADGAGSAVFQGDMNMFDIRYLYVVGVDINPQPAGDAFHCEQCSYVLLRNMDISGGDREAHETIKVNQSSYIYIEDSNIHGAGDNTIDFVAVQYGHIVRNTISNAGDWCMYVKGGSAYLLIEANRIFNCQTGGFTSGQGTGFEFMTSPWLHYESYDIKFINNIIHDTVGAGFGVNGGYNILFAHNTLYRVGSASHAIEVVYGLRSCDGMTSACSAHLSEGGWGTTLGGGYEEAIPNKNIYIFNNILYNPNGFQSQYAHFSIQGPRSSGSGSNLPTTVRTDTNLRIKGNILWNGPAGLSLGIEDSSQGCRNTNPTCNEQQLRSDNAINTILPALENPSSGNFKPTLGGNIYAYQGASLISFQGGDREQFPLAPQGTLTNTVSRDFEGRIRSLNSPIGAYAGPIRARTQANGYLLWNGFLEMINIAELVNTGSSALPVTLTLFDLSGNAIAQANVLVPAKSQRDIILNDIVGFQANSYGLVTLDFNSDNLTARLSVYRNGRNADEFDFAYATEKESPIQGRSYLSFNTIQPSRSPAQAESPVSNWISITNAEPSRALQFTVKRFNQTGEVVTQIRVSVPPFGRVDIEGGHENPGPSQVGLNEIIPDDLTGKYFANLVRYGHAGNGFSFAYPLKATVSQSSVISLPVSSGGNAENWIEVINTTNSEKFVVARFYSSNGSLISGNYRFSLTPKSQTHINANQIIGSSASGLVRIESSGGAGVIANSLFYFYSSIGTIDAMYGIEAQSIGNEEQSGSYNLFLRMFNWLKISNVSGVSSTVRVLVHSGLTTQEATFSLPAYATIDMPLHEQSRFGTRVNSYGVIEVIGEGLTSHILRIKPSDMGFDYVYPTQVR